MVIISFAPRIIPTVWSGLMRDENNQNHDIIEWEEYDVYDLRNNEYDPYLY